MTFRGISSPKFSVLVPSKLTLMKETTRTIRGSSSDAVRGPIWCDICKVSLHSQGFLDRHIKSLHSREDLWCKECGVVKNTRKQLRDHMRLHLKRFCHICEKMVAKNNFPRHLKLCQRPKTEVECQLKTKERQTI